MADREHLAILKRGSSAWNEWRGENPQVVPDLSQAHLQQARLSGANLSGANLRPSYFGQADLSGADLCHADLSETSLRRAYLASARLDNANLVGARRARILACAAAVSLFTWVATAQTTPLAASPPIGSN